MANQRAGTRDAGWMRRVTLLKRMQMHGPGGGMHRVPGAVGCDITARGEPHVSGMWRHGRLRTSREAGGRTQAGRLAAASPLHSRWAAVGWAISRNMCPQRPALCTMVRQMTGLGAATNGAAGGTVAGGAGIGQNGHLQGRLGTHCMLGVAGLAKHLPPCTNLHHMLLPLQD